MIDIRLSPSSYSEIEEYALKQQGSKFFLFPFPYHDPPTPNSADTSSAVCIVQINGTADINHNGRTLHMCRVAAIELSISKLRNEALYVGRSGPQEM